MPEREPLLYAAARLEAATTELSEKFERVDTFAQETAKAHKRTRDLTYLVIAGLLVELLIIVVLAVALNRVDDATDRLDTQEDVDVQSCERGNDTRRAQRQQWVDARKLLIDLGAGRETRKLADGLVANAHRNFPHYDCSVVREGKKPPVIPPPR